MPLPMVILEDTSELSTKESLKAVEAFLDNHYEFRCEDKYKGLFGRIRAFFVRDEAERCERRNSCERYIEYLRSITLYSDPFSRGDGPPEEFFVLAEKNSFSAALMEFIAAKGKNHVEVYKCANIDRKLFSKIRKCESYIPSKKTIIALALALELSLDETNDLLKHAGFVLSRSILFDVIIEYFISQGKYDIHEIDDVLFAYKQSTLI